MRNRRNKNIYIKHRGRYTCTRGRLDVIETITKVENSEVPGEDNVTGEMVQKYNKGLDRCSNCILVRGAGFTDEYINNSGDSL